MKKDNIIIEGREYLSSSRAAEIAGYSRDYVGQLSRLGKVNSRMIGRSWYIEKDSILKHQQESSKLNQTSFKPTHFLQNTGVPFGADPSGMTLAVPGGILHQTRSIPRAITQGATVHSRLEAPRLSLIAVGFVAVMVTAVPTFFGLNSSRIAGNMMPAQQMTANVSDALNIFSTLTKSLLNALQGKATTSDMSDLGSEPGADLAHGGLVVVPSEDATTTNEKLANTITNSFSDPVEVSQNGDTNNGTITPVFKTIKGHDYLYVLVPVKASTSTQAQDTDQTPANK